MQNGVSMKSLTQEFFNKGKQNIGKVRQFWEKWPTMQTYRFYYFETLIQALRDTLQNIAGFLTLFWISVIICVFVI